MSISWSAGACSLLLEVAFTSTFLAEVKGTCSSLACDAGEPTWTRSEFPPDLVFLDVQMPGTDGFDVLRALPKENSPGVIFVTAYEEHALRAFRSLRIGLSTQAGG
jgi:CheY-like chemotaxis protein